MIIAHKKLPSESAKAASHIFITWSERNDKSHRKHFESMMKIKSKYTTNDNYQITGRHLTLHDT